MGAIEPALSAIEWFCRKLSKKLKYLIAKIVEIEGSLVIEELDKGLLEMRNTPNENGLSAAQMVFGQDLRSVLPSIRASLLKEKKKNYYNLHSKTLSEPCIKQRVRVQDKETKRWNKNWHYYSDW